MRWGGSTAEICNGWERKSEEKAGKGLTTNYMDKIALRFGSDLVVAISAKPQA
jgi:hypothetical protein